MLKHTFTILNNGLPVLRIPMPGVESATVLVLTNTGSRFEKPEHYGIAHFFEHMVFKGTEKFPQAQMLAEAVDGVGADFNAFTSKEYTGYYVKAASRHVDLALDVVSDMLLAPKLRQSDIDREKGVILEELNMYKDTPARHIGNLFEEMMYQGSGLEHEIIGLPETITSVKSADFQQFLHDWYGLPNMLLVVAGDERVVGEKTDLLDVITQMFSKKAHKRVDHKVDTRKLVSKEGFGSQRLRIEHKPTEQAHLVLGWPGIDRYNDDRYVLSLLGTVLGGNMSSRLFSEVREKRGLAYYVRSETDIYHTRGVFGASAGVDVKRIHQAIEVIIEEFIQLATGKKPITAKELSRAKEYEAGKMALSYEDSQSVAYMYGLRQVLTGKIETPEESLKKVRAVTLDQVNELAARLVADEQLRLAVIGPYKNQDEFERFVK